MEFSNKSKAALATILKCMQEAQAAFSVLSDAEKDQCLNFHTEGASVNHCLRWGEQAAQDLLDDAGGPPKKWGVLLEMEDQKPYFWTGTADDGAHAEGQAIARATAYSEEQVLATVKVQCLDDYVMSLTVPCTEIMSSEGLSSIALSSNNGVVQTHSPLEARERLQPSDRFNLALINAALEEATEDALNAGCLALQNAMGVKEGDVASIHFSGTDSVSPIQGALTSYAQLELFMSRKDSD